MKKILFYIVAAVFIPLQLSAQVRGIVYDSEGNPLPATTVSWLGTNVAVMTGFDGRFQIDTHEESTKLVFSHLGFASDTVEVLNPQAELQVFLEEVVGVELEEITVQGTRRTSFNPHHTIAQTQVLTASEFRRAACCNLGQSFTTNPSVEVVYSDAATGARQIRMLGLSGNYVQLLIENTPSFRGLASTFGLSFIPGAWMENISISKGAASVTNGFEGITGQINVELKQPKSSERLHLNLAASSAGRFDANLTSAIRINNNLSTGILAHVSKEVAEHDHNNDGFMDMPKTRQYNLLNRWHFQRGNYVGHFGFRALYENRTGGQMSNISNPFRIGIETQRYELFMRNGYILDESRNRSIGLILSASMHEQDSHFGTRVYDARHRNLYANLLYQTSFDNHHQLIAGASFIADRFDEYWLPSGTLGSRFSRSEFVPGIFGEYTLSFQHRVQILLGLRGDHHSQFGFFATPRIHFKYNITDNIQLRASAGKGYRTPNILAENNFLLASNRVIENVELLNNLKQERAWNYGFNFTVNIPFGWRLLTLNGEWYYTNFREQAVVDMDTNPNSVSFHNLDGRSFSNSMQIEATAELIRGWTMTLAYRYSDVRTTINGVLREKPLQSRYRAMLTTSYFTPRERWQFDLTTQLNGGGRMPDPCPVNPLWDREFNPFVLLQAQITKNFGNWSIYAGSENLTNFTQANPIISAQDVASPNFDASMVWGPLHGRKFYLGMRWDLR